MGYQVCGSWTRVLLPITILLLSSAVILLHRVRYGPPGLGLRLTDTTVLTESRLRAIHYTSPRPPLPLPLPKVNTTHERTIAIRRRVETVEEGLARARAAIRLAAETGNTTDDVDMGEAIEGSNRIYRNPAAFYQSYAEMEKRFKVYVYEEGEAPLVHDGPCKNIYTTEGRFIQELEMIRRSPESGDGRRSLRTWDPKRAHAFFMPFSVTMLVEYVYQPLTFDHTPIRRFVADYIGVIASKYGFWNRTSGSDHFMLSCHDWGPSASKANPQLYNNSIRALCNANTTEGFQPRKDVSIPEINLVTGELPTKLLSPPQDSMSRPYLGFFAGRLHGPIRPILINHWKGKDNDLRVFEYLPRGMDYYSFMLQSKFCLCPSGYEVASPRVVEAIYSECVPVLISEGYVLPFSDVLRWEEFSVAVEVKDIPRLKEILEAVPEEKLRRLREGVRAVRKHFVFNQPPQRMDVFHMILHSVWLRRLNARLW